MYHGTVVLRRARRSLLSRRQQFRLVLVFDNGETFLWSESYFNHRDLLSQGVELAHRLGWGFTDESGVGHNG